LLGRRNFKPRRVPLNELTSLWTPELRLQKLLRNTPPEHPDLSTMARSALTLALLACTAAFAGAESNAGRSTGPYVISVDSATSTEDKAASVVRPGDLPPWFTAVQCALCRA